MNTHTTLASVCLLLASDIPAQKTLRPGKPSDVGMSAAVLDAGASLFRDTVAHDQLKGVVLLVARHGRIGASTQRVSHSPTAVRTERLPGWTRSAG